MKVSEIRNFSRDELVAKIAEKEQELAIMRFQVALHQYDNVIKVRLTRRDLARMKTILREDTLNLNPLTGNSAK